MMFSWQYFKHMCLRKTNTNSTKCTPWYAIDPPVDTTVPTVITSVCVDELFWEVVSLAAESWLHSVRVCFASHDWAETQQEVTSTIIRFI